MEKENLKESEFFLSAIGNLCYTIVKHDASGLRISYFDVEDDSISVGDKIPVPCSDSKVFVKIEKEVYECAVRMFHAVAEKYWQVFVDRAIKTEGQTEHEGEFCRISTINSSTYGTKKVHDEDDSDLLENPGYIIRDNLSNHVQYSENIFQTAWVAVKEPIRQIKLYLKAQYEKRQPMKKRVFIDMDNVLVDFRSGLDTQSKETLQQYEGRLDEIPNLFSKMKPMPGAIEAVHKLNERYDLFILSTAPWKNPSAWSDKVKWVTQHLDDVFHKRMVITHRKDLCQGDYLIDDRGKNGTSEFGGEWIEFGSSRFPDWQSVLDYLCD